jgi:hypothetical protein
MRLTQRPIRRYPASAVASMAALVALGTAVVPAFASPMSSPRALTASELAADASACAGLRPADVAAYAAQVRDARMQDQRRPSEPNLSSPSAVRAFILATMPRYSPGGGSTHALTSQEFATDRAGSLVATTTMGVFAAIGACRGQAAAAHARNQPLQTCGHPPCYVPWPVKTTYDTIGDYTDLCENQQTGTYVSATGFTPRGTQATTGSIQLVSNTTWEPWVNGGKGGTATFPAVAQTAATSATSIVGNLPVPSSVPQSGWVVLPGSNQWAFLAADSVLVPIDASGNDYYMVNAVASGGMQSYVHAQPPGGQAISQYSPITYAASGGFVTPSLGGTALLTAQYLSKIPGYGNVNSAAAITGDTLSVTTVWNPIIFTDTSWSSDAGYFDGSGNARGIGCDVAMPGLTSFGGHATPLGDSCAGDDW